MSAREVLLLPLPLILLLLLLFLVLLPTSTLLRAMLGTTQAFFHASHAPTHVPTHSPRSGVHPPALPARTPA